MLTIITIVCVSFLAAALYAQFAKPSTGRFIWLALVSGVTYYFLTHNPVDSNVLVGCAIGGSITVVMWLIRDSQKANKPQKTNKPQ